jgi:NhaP-type Na+/H+ or K+/H+ antiporter
MLAVRTDLLNKIGMFIAVAAIAPVAVWMNLSDMKLEAALLGFFVTPILAVAISKLTNKKTVA